MPKRPLHRMLLNYLWSSLFFWVPALVFLAVASQVRGNEPLPGDAAVLTADNSAASSWLTNAFIIITSLGSAPFVIAGVSIAVATLWYIGRRRDSLFLLFAAGGTAAINIMFKLIFERDRPDLWEHLVVEYGYSFPSGHAMISASLALAVIILAWPTKYRWAAVTIGSLYVLLVGISRVYLGVHYPSDVIGGWCVSVLWIVTLYNVLTRFSFWKHFAAK